MRLLALLLLCSPAFADPVEEAADRALEAFSSEESSVLAELAEADDPDPWILVEALWYRGELDAAQALAAASDRKDLEKLPEYVETLRGKTPDAEARERLRTSNRAFRARDHATALRALGPPPSHPQTVTAIRHAYARGANLRGLRKLIEAERAFTGSAEAARQLGWLSRASAALHEAGAAAYRRADARRAMELWKERLELCEERGDKKHWAGTLCNLGLLQNSVGRFRESIEYYKRALPPLRELEATAFLANTLGNLAMAHWNLGDEGRAIELEREAMAIREESSDRTGLASSLACLGFYLAESGDIAAGRPLLERAIVLTRELRIRDGLADSLSNLGRVLTRTGEHDRASACLTEAIEIRRALGNPVMLARAHLSRGDLREWRSEWERAKECYREAQRIAERCRHGPLMAESLAAVARMLRATGEFEQARRCLEEALAIQERVRARAATVVTRIELADLVFDLGETARALELLECANDVALEEESPKLQCVALCALGTTLSNSGDNLGAREAYRRMCDRAREAGLKNAQARGQANLAQTLGVLGDYDRALENFAQALGLFRGMRDRAGEAGALGGIGIVHRDLGRYREAVSCLQQAFDIVEEIGQGAALPAAYGNLGYIQLELGNEERARESFRLGLECARNRGRLDRLAELNLGMAGALLEAEDIDEAEDHLDKALSQARSSGRRRLEASILDAQAQLALDREDHDLAWKLETLAKKRFEEVGNRDSASRAHVRLGFIALARGRPEEANEILEEARREIGEFGSPRLRVALHEVLAHVRFEQGDNQGAMRAAREAIRLSTRLTCGLHEFGRVTIRERWQQVPIVGMQAAVELGDMASLCHFFEAGRARSLLDALGGHQAVAEVVLDEALLRRDHEAHMAEATALAAYRAALDTGSRKEVQAARRALSAARGEVERVEERIQLEAGRAMEVVFTEPMPLSGIREHLREKEALVLYQHGDLLTLAFVVTRKGGRAVDLGPTAAIRDALEALDPRRSDRKAVATLEGLLVAPLDLPAATKRILVSPQGESSRVPFVLLAGDREVCYVPSATAWALLRERTQPTGKDVLAFGDPDLGSGAVTLMRSGRSLGRLPESAREAEAVGDEVLIGRTATETRLRALGSGGKRWRAIHLACHGQLDLEKPMLSSLVLAADDRNDGLLTVLDVFGLELPTDLAALSACESARGKVYRAEGVVGLTRAFLHAGAPRVIVSLWRVDDEATRALMEEFYRLWKPGGVPAATALRKAQEHVASRKRWKDPYYWAAWQLWGLPD